MREKFTVLFILFLSILCKAQNSDVQNLTKEVRSIMYSDPKKALETADYILSIQNSISKSEIYEALLLQAELYVNLREYNLALLKLISANKISQEVSNPFLKCKAEYILAQIYLKLEFKENYNRSLAQLKQYAKKLKDQQQTTVINYITELNLISRHQENKFNSFSKESRTDDTYRNALDPTYKIRSHIIELSINQSPLTSNDSLRYFQFLYALKKIEFEINAGRLNEKFIKDLQEKYPEYNAGLFYLYIYKK